MTQEQLLNEILKNPYFSGKKIRGSFENGAQSLLRAYKKVQNDSAKERGLRNDLSVYRVSFAAAHDVAIDALSGELIATDLVKLSDTLREILISEVDAMPSFSSAKAGAFDARCIILNELNSLLGISYV